MWTTMVQGSAWVLDGLAGLVWVWSSGFIGFTGLGFRDILVLKGEWGEHNNDIL